MFTCMGEQKNDFFKLETPTQLCTQDMLERVSLGNISNSQSSDSAENDAKQRKITTGTEVTRFSSHSKQIISPGGEFQRNIRQEQLTQLIAARIQEGELLISSNKEEEWQVGQVNSAWNVYAKTCELNYLIMNEINIEASYEIAKEKICELRKKESANDALTSEKSIIKLSDNLSIIYKCSNSGEQIDSLSICLERSSKKDCYQRAEMSIEDKRYPVVPGIKREHLEFLYWRLTPGQESSAYTKLWIIEIYKLRAKGDEAEIKLAHEKNANFVHQWVSSAELPNNSIQFLPCSIVTHLTTLNEC